MRTFSHIEKGVSIDLDNYLRVKLAQQTDGNWTVVFDQSTGPNDNYSDDCASEALTVVTGSTSSMTLSATCELPSTPTYTQESLSVTADVSIEISQFLVNRNGEIAWEN